jgi:hypothetical protein
VSLTKTFMTKADEAAAKAFASNPAFVKNAAVAPAKKDIADSRSFTNQTMARAAPDNTTDRTPEKSASPETQREAPLRYSSSAPAPAASAAPDLLKPQTETSRNFAGMQNQAPPVLNEYHPDKNNDFYTTNIDKKGGLAFMNQAMRERMIIEEQKQEQERNEELQTQGRSLSAFAGTIGAMDDLIADIDEQLAEIGSQEQQIQLRLDGAKGQLASNDKTIAAGDRDINELLTQYGAEYSLVKGVDQTSESLKSQLNIDPATTKVLYQTQPDGTRALVLFDTKTGQIDAVDPALAAALDANTLQNTPTIDEYREAAPKAQIVDNAVNGVESTMSQRLSFIDTRNGAQAEISGLASRRSQLQSERAAAVERRNQMALENGGQPQTPSAADNTSRTGTSANPAFDSTDAPPVNSQFQAAATGITPPAPETSPDLTPQRLQTLDFSNS